MVQAVVSSGNSGLGFWWTSTLRDLLQALYDDTPQMADETYRNGRYDVLMRMATLLNCELDAHEHNPKGVITGHVSRR
jgi:hypothetical protein